MRVMLYPKLTANTTTEIILIWTAQLARVARRRILNLLATRPGWSLISVHYHDDLGSHDAAS